MTLKQNLMMAAGAALVFTLAACGGNKGGEEGVPTLRRGITAKVDTLDPHKSSAQWENIIIGDMFVGLMTDASDGTPINGMAESYEVDETGTIWTFKLKPDVVWSDGVPVTAEDFVYGFRRLQDPLVASQYSSLLYLVKNAEAVNNQTLPPEELGIRAIDEKTLEITLEYPAPYLLGLLTHYTTFPVPRHTIEEFGDAWIQPDNIVVNGPYKLAYWRTGDQLVVDKNPLWEGAEGLCFDRVAYFELEDAAAVERKIRAGDLDINNDFDGARKSELEGILPGWARTTPALITTYWVFNSSVEPFDDVRVRTALAMALDREFLVDKVMTPGYVPAYSMVPPGIDNYDTDVPEVSWKGLTRPERLAEAKRLLEDAGYGPDNPLEFEFIYRSTGGNEKPPPVAQANWKEIAGWVDPNILKQDTKVLYARLRQSDFEVSDAAWVADFSDPQNYLYLLDSATGQQNYGNYANAEYDALLASANVEMNLQVRAGILAEAESLMLEEAPITPMWFQVTKNLVDPTLTGWTENARDNHRSRWLCRADIE